MRIILAAVIPAYNEESVITETIQSILLAGMKKSDIYVIDDHSSDNTGGIASDIGVNVLRHERNLGKAESVEQAISKLHLLTRYSHICFLDADTLVHEKYFKEVRTRLQRELTSLRNNPRTKPVSVLCGKAKSIPNNYLTAFRAYEYWITHKIHKPAQAQMGVIMVAPGCASTYSSEILKNVTWSSDTVVEDMDMTIQVALLGGRILYENKAVVYTQDPRTLKDYVGQIGKRWYPGTWQVIGKHGLLWKGPLSGLHWESRLLILEPFVYVGTILWTLVSNPEYTLLTFASVFILTLLLSFFASIEERRIDILKYSPAFTFIFFLNLFLFVVRVPNIRGRKKERKWFSPKRYKTKLESRGT